MNLFIYGTLLVPKIWEAVTGCPETKMLPATLAGYQIHRVKSADFPAITKGVDSDAFVVGRVALDISTEALRRLDAYEDDFYDRLPVKVSVSGIVYDADTYVIASSMAAETLSTESWTLDWFEKNALDNYWNRVIGA